MRLTPGLITFSLNGGWKNAESKTTGNISDSSGKCRDGFVNKTCRCHNGSPFRLWIKKENTAVATIFQYSPPHTVRLRRCTSDELLYGAHSRRAAGTNDMLEALVKLPMKHGLSRHLPEHPYLII